MAGISSFHVGCLERTCLLGNAEMLRNASLGLLWNSSTFQGSWISLGFAVSVQKWCLQTRLLPLRNGKGENRMLLLLRGGGCS